MEQLLTIGEFAQRCGLSRSALRFYDQNDLLRPQLVDEETGYRYYATAQIRRAALVRRLRAAEMPVGLVRTYLGASVEDRRAILDGHLASFRERVSGVESAVDGLRRELMAAGEADGTRFCRVAAALFAEALSQVRFAVADPAERAELGAVWVETREGSLRLVTTDSYRLAVRDLPPEQITADGLRGVIDAARIGALTHALAGADTLALAQDAAGTVLATVDGCDLMIGHAGQGFPDYERILVGLPAGHRGVVGHDAIRRALVDLSEEVAQLCLEFTTARLTLRAGDREVSVDCDWSGPELEIFMNARFFTEAIDATVGPDLVIEASDPLQPVTLRSADTGTFSVLTMPIRAPGAE